VPQETSVAFERVALFEGKEKGGTGWVSSEGGSLSERMPCVFGGVVRGWGG